MRACEFTHLNIKSAINETSHSAARRAPQQLTRWYAIQKQENRLKRLVVMQLNTDMNKTQRKKCATTTTTTTSITE